jgi:nucleotide-binding universal stress UspA family protein
MKLPLRILCAVDVTEAARPVTAAAASLARSLGARLELCHVVHLPPGLPAEHLSGNEVVDVPAVATAALETRAAELRARGIDVRVHVAVGGVEEGISNRLRERGTDIVVIGTHARRGVARSFLGSIAERIVKTAPCPVVVVPPATGGRLARESFSGPLKIVAGIDLSPASDAALAWLRVVEAEAPCEIRLVHLYWPPREHARLGQAAPDAPEPNVEVVAGLTRELREHVAAHLGRGDVPLRVRPFWGADEEPLLREAESDDPDLLVVGTSQDRHSTALATLRSSSLPVVCVPSAWSSSKERRNRHVARTFL